MASNASSSRVCPASADESFGPFISSGTSSLGAGPGCRAEGFDFTLAFEQYVFTILPACLLLLAAPPRLWWLLRRRGGDGKGSGRPTTTRREGWMKWAKLGGLSALAALQLALTVVWATTTPGGSGTGEGSAMYRSISPRLRASLTAASAVSLCSSVAILALSAAEHHGRSRRPSVIINAYLFVSGVLDAVALRTLWLLAGSIPAAASGVATAALAVKLVVLVVLEAGPTTEGKPTAETPSSPEESSGLFGLGLLLWLNGLLLTGFRRLLRPDDLYPVDAAMSSAGLSARFRSRWAADDGDDNVTRRKQGRLIPTCFRVLFWPLLAAVPARLALLGFTICQPLLLNRLLDYLQRQQRAAGEEGGPEPRAVGYGLVGAYGLVYVGIAVAASFYWHRAYRAVAMLRGMLMAAVFRKTLGIGTTAVDNAAAVTLMSSDVDRIVRAARDFHELWANVLQVAISTWLLSRQIDYACVAPVVVSCVTLALTLLIAPHASSYQVKWIEMVQRRVGITSDILGHIKSVKMLGLSGPVASQLQRLRVDEMAAALPSRLVATLTSAVAQIPPLIAPAAAFAVYTTVAAGSGGQGGRTLDATRMFSALSLVVLLTQPLFLLFEVVLDVATAVGCFGRIERFLLAETRRDGRTLPDAAGRGFGAIRPAEDDGAGAEMELRELAAPTKGKGAAAASPDDDDVDVAVSGLTLAWTASGPAVVEDASLAVRRGQLAVITGPAAAGKSTLLKALLGEVPVVVAGSVRLGRARVAYCDQTPWLMNDTIRNNIVGLSPVDAVLYDEVVRACDLDKDFLQLAAGDETVVGSKGMALSGGQKQRIALARAVYSRPEVAILDDVFSGLDNHTASRVFAALFGPDSGVLRGWGTSCVLVTQAARLLPLADHVLVLGEGGRTVEQGAFGSLVAAGEYVQRSVYRTAAGGGVDGGDSGEDGGEGEGKRGDDDGGDGPAPSAAAKMKEAPPKPAEQADKRRQEGDHSVYGYYLGTVGVAATVALLALEVVWSFLSTFPTVWLKWWSDANSSSSSSTTTSSPPSSSGSWAYYLGGYWGLQVGALVSFGALVWLMLVVVAARSGIELHRRLVVAVVRAPLAFLTAVDTGSLVTRFSQDMGLVDHSLPLALVMSLMCLFTTVAKAALIASASAYIAVSFPFVAVLFYLLQRAYLRTSRQLRLLDLELKAPVYTQFLETLDGLTSIRAFNWGAASERRNHALVDAAQRPFYLLMMVQQWLALALDLVTAALALLVVGLAVGVTISSSSSGSVGLAGVSLVQLISLSETVKLLIQFWTSLETSIAAVTRVKHFAEETPDENLPGEGGSGAVHLPPGWPASGAVAIEGVSASYSSSSTTSSPSSPPPSALALDDVSLTIRPGEKVGVCGRTGSGKSTLLLALLRLVELSAGAVVVDGVDCARLARDDLRRRFVTVAQDQLVLPGRSVRHNLDPFFGAGGKGDGGSGGGGGGEDATAAARDAAMVEALRKVGLWEGVLSDLGGGGRGLDADLSREVLSPGQWQLFFLARAVLQRRDRGRVVLLDEVSSGVDAAAEALVARLVRDEFADHTVVAVAHRLESIVDFDTVVVMDGGCLVEKGEPRELLRTKGSRFRALWEAAHVGNRS